MCSRAVLRCRDKKVRVFMDTENKKFGLEMEIMRVTRGGGFTKTPHPFACDKNIERDFCENQLELITPPCATVDEMTDVLGRLIQKARDGIGDELLWPYSCPPHFESEDEIAIADYTGKSSPKRDYRNALCQKYGKRLMLYSGIHFNFSFDGAQLYKLGADTVHKKNKLYLKLAKYCNIYSCILVLLTAASPVFDKSLTQDGAGDGFDGYASQRQGKKGYYNSFTPVLDYTSLENYTGSITAYVDKGMLISPSELYTPIRLKPKGDYSLSSLLKNGINHIELRMFDINPLFPLLINPADIYFAYYLILYLSALDDISFTPQMQIESIANHKDAALYDVSRVKVGGKYIIDAALSLMDKMSVYFADDPAAVQTIKYQVNKLVSNKRYCIEIREKFGKDFGKRMTEFSEAFTDIKNTV